MAEIKWIKITTDIFDDEKIKIIDTMPDRDAVIVIWFKLLALTGKKNNSGLLFMSARMPYTEEMLATIFNRPLNTVRMALKLFEDFEMIEVADNKVISVINWEKHQNIDGMDKIKEQNRLRQKAFREKQKLLTGNKNSNVTSRDNNAIEEDKEKEEDKNKNIKPIVHSKELNIPFETFWNSYDKKRNKPKCIKKWEKLKDQDRIDIMGYIPRYKKSQPDKTYRKDPMTFLNNEGWKDEIIDKCFNNKNNQTKEFKPTNWMDIVNNDNPKIESQPTEVEYID